MIFHKTSLEDAYIIEAEPIEDERGYFARTWCKREFEAQGLSSELVQCSISFNKRRGTLRGMHYQIAPYEEVKLVRCTRGSIFDVIIDMRPNSRTYLKWISIELTANNRKMLYIPAGFAHGFQTLEDNTEVSYQMNEFYHPECARGIRWDDPLFNIDWPITDQIIMSEKDRAYLYWREGK
ncbi:dTDP-4-dehydrorhamnose 3,5-epimerase [Paenibacillus zeisoli]|uniref:dTDP-4-dehydrorhamnose 3,5-epimerase n=1 Tax=Paenibacillus zeisoli TaxID=2496267 RepID=A0A3S1B8I8_9BACL|nr:dTDP-4-dehydrorhamnose 3,5-epimerase [Paenibacillus zeisoli]RUT33267.1 dTDP-4-dehydrorhamnose 3,5-epimerase [Paenibacillus zeisoli]